MALSNNYMGDWELSPDGQTLTNRKTGQTQPNYQYGIGGQPATGGGWSNSPADDLRTSQAWEIDADFRAFPGLVFGQESDEIDCLCDLCAGLG